MNTITVVRNRIFQLCGKHEISINKLATIFALPPSSSQLQCNHEKKHIRQIPIEEHYIKLYLLSKMSSSLKTRSAPETITDKRSLQRPDN